MPSEEYVDFVHTGPATPAGRFLRTFWQPIHRSADLAEGRTAAIKIMSEDFTLYRGESGVPHLLEFRCAHRRSQLSVGWIEDDCIRCFYHGWKYDGAGQCVEQPGEDEPFAHKVRLQSYPVREYLGLIFAYLGEGEPPPMLGFPEFEEPGVLEVFSPSRGRTTTSTASTTRATRCTSPSSTESRAAGRGSSRRFSGMSLRRRSTASDTSRSFPEGRSGTCATSSCPIWFKSLSI